MTKQENLKQIFLLSLDLCRPWALDILLEAASACHGDIKLMAGVLGCSRQTLHRIFKRQPLLLGAVKQCGRPPVEGHVDCFAKEFAARIARDFSNTKPEPAR